MGCEEGLEPALGLDGLAVQHRVLDGQCGPSRQLLGHLHLVGVDVAT